MPATLKLNFSFLFLYLIANFLNNSFLSSEIIEHLKYKIGSLPVTEYLSKNMLSLPFYPGMNKNKITYLFNKLREVIK